MKIHHYTSIETLALILKTKKIRLNNLADVNDLEEGNTIDCGNIARYYHVSCWTMQKKESIPLWNMYAGMNGVRLTFSNKFLGEPNTESSQHVHKKNKEHLILKDCQDSKIVYTECKKILCPEIDKGGKIDFEKVGRYKRTAWKFEKEWRIMRFAANITTDYTNTESDKLLKSKNGNIFRFYNEISLKYTDLPIFENHFKKMEILMGPKISEGNKLIIVDLVAKYNPTAKITESSLKIK
jgi:hypothetical protein